MENSRFKIIVIGIFIYILSTFVSYALFSFLASSKERAMVTSSTSGQKKDSLSALTFNENLPKTEACPLNGALYSKEQKAWWEKHRPLGVMIENHEDARPQSGLSSADIVYEAVAEGGITRFLALFYCQDAGIIGPVRSARTYFVDFISEYGNNPLYAHVGGANCNGETGSGCANGAKADAIGQIESYGWRAYNDLDQYSISYPYYWRDADRLGHEVATEHTMYSTTSKLWSYASETRKLTNVDEEKASWDDSFVQYKFAKKEQSVSKRPESQTISFDFWKDYAQYAVKWAYDKASNSYLRFNGGKEHIDRDNNKQLSAKNIVILFMTEKSANDGYDNNLHLLYGTKGTGKAIVFMDGKETQATWSKKDREARTIIKDNSGSEIEFNPGLIWFEILPVGIEVVVK